MEKRRGNRRVRVNPWFGYTAVNDCRDNISPLPGKGNLMRADEPKRNKGAAKPVAGPNLFLDKIPRIALSLHCYILFDPRGISFRQSVRPDCRIFIEISSLADCAGKTETGSTEKNASSRPSHTPAAL
ncbi:MAG: hypothetical protein ACKV2V_30485 [Blastocatellia bacterium]